MQLQQIADKATTIANVKTVEQCGSWLWIEAPRRSKELRGLGMKWSKKKSRWFYAGSNTKSRRPHTMPEIRTRFGSKILAKYDITLDNPIIEQEVENEIKALASFLASEANQELSESKQFLQEIISYGGIRKYKGGHEDEEYSAIPKPYRRKDGLPLDEIAQEMQTTVNDLLSDVARSENIKSMLPRKVSKFRVKDFENEAASRIIAQRRADGTLSG